jgi:neutral ceramidase
MIRLIGFVFLALSCCATVEGRLPPPQQTSQPPPAALEAGFGIEDITPQPGFPLGGHSIASRIARGHWTRLQARALYLRDRANTAVVLISCDLWAPDGALTDRVAELLAADPATHHLAREHVVLAATHTHQSPGNYSTNRFYSSFASSHSGFDVDLFEFLAVRIVGSVKQAVAAARPVEMKFAALTVEGLVRNRSFAAFRANAESAAVLEEQRTLPPGPPDPADPDPRTYRAIDPTLRALVLETEGKPAIVAAIFAVHPTAVGHSAELYSADLFGVAVRIAEQKLADAFPGVRPRVLLFNGPEGDVSPAWDVQGRAAATDLGERLGTALARVARSPRTDVSSPEISVRHDIVDLEGATFADEWGQRRSTTDRPLNGAPQLGGAEDGRTWLYPAIVHEGMPGPWRRGHGRKRTALWVVGDVVAGVLTPAHRVPLTVIAIGDVVFGTLPGEFTTVMGRRIERSLRRADSSARFVGLIGLAQEYSGYFTTPEEYDAQHYEGASTFYGPNAGTFVGEALTQLLRGARTGSPPPPRRDAFAYGPLQARGFGPQLVTSHTNYPRDGVADFFPSRSADDYASDPPSFTWCDRTLPYYSPGPLGGPVYPLVRVVRHGTGGPQEVESSDKGSDLVVICRAVDASGSVWSATWTPKASAVDRTREHHIEVTSPSGFVFTSPPFRP